MNNDALPALAKFDAKKKSRRFRTLGVTAAACAALVSAACSSPEARVEKYYTSGQEFLEKGEYGKANVQFQSALKIDEAHVPTLEGLARIAEERQDLKSMFGLFQRIARVDPYNVNAHVQLGKLYLISSDETTALEKADLALQLDPDNIDAIALKSGVMLRVGDTQKAVELARQAIAVDPTNAEATTVLSTERAMNRDFEGAVDELDRALNIDPKIAVLQLLRIRLLAELDRNEDVLAGFGRLVELFPEEPVYRRAYAAEFIKRKQYDDALAQLEAVVAMDEESLDAKLDVVRVVNAKDGMDAAESVLRAYVDAEPNNYDLRFALAELLREQEELDKSEALLTPLMSNEDATIANKAKNRVAILKLLDGDRAQSEKLVDEILADDENNTEALIKKASFQIDDDQYDDAIANLRAALNNNPDLVEAMMLMSRAFERQDNIDFARAELAKAFDASGRAPRVANIYAKFQTRHGNARRAENVLVQSLAAHPGDLENLKLLAAVRLDLQDWQGAEEVAGLIEGLEDGESDSLARNIRSYALSGLGDYDRLIETLKPENENAPLRSRPLATLVNAYVQSDRADDAVTMLNNILETDPQNYSAYIYLAQTYGALRNEQEAESILQKAVRTEPSRPEAYELLYRYYLASGNREKALSTIENGLSADPDSEAMNFFKADILLSSGDMEGALDIYADLIEKRPNDIIVANNFVSLTSDLRQDQQSLERAKEVAKVLETNENPFVQDTVGWLYYQAGDYDKAVEYLSKAVSGAENNAELLYHYGAAQIASGRAQEGRETLTKALEVKGENFRHEDAIRVLLAKQ